MGKNLPVSTGDTAVTLVGKILHVAGRLWSTRRSLAIRSWREARAARRNQTDAYHCKKHDLLREPRELLQSRGRVRADGGRGGWREGRMEHCPGGPRVPCLQTRLPQAPCQPWGVPWSPSCL